MKKPAFITTQFALTLQKGTAKSFDISIFESHFKGIPYFTSKDEYPVCSHCGNHFSFITQISRLSHPEITLPEEADILQFFYCYHCNPYRNDEPGWLVRLVHDAELTDLVSYEDVASPKEFHTIQLTKQRSYPCYTMVNYFKEHYKAEWEEVAKNNHKIAHSLTSAIGGFPIWLQAADYPFYKDHPIEFVMQIDSEYDAGIHWVDGGLVYLFYNPKTSLFYFDMQFM